MRKVLVIGADGYIGKRLTKHLSQLGITVVAILPVQEIPGKTTIAVEYPIPYNLKDGTEPYYPIPTETKLKNISTILI